MKNPWEYMTADTNPKKKKAEKNNKDESDAEDDDGMKEDDPRILKLVQVIGGDHNDVCALSS